MALECKNCGKTGRSEQDREIFFHIKILHLSHWTISICYFARTMVSPFPKVIQFLYIIGLSVIILVKNQLYNITIGKKKKTWKGKMKAYSKPQRP